MDFERDVFKRKKVDLAKLKEYGFVLKVGIYTYEKKLDDNFKVIITYDDQIKGKIIDLDFDEEYVNFRLENQTGSFVSDIREKYISVLKDICDSCFSDKYFIFDQSNRITSMIRKKYGDKPIFKWEDNKSAVFENGGKWYGIIMCTDRSKITDGCGEIEVLNVKLDQNKILNLLKERGYYKAYHMNKKNWISIILDDTLSDKTIFNLIEDSYSYTVSTLKADREWIMPINPNYFDVSNYFDSTDLYYWDKKHAFKKDDVLYLYITKPIGAIMYKCVIDDVSEDFTLVKKICKYDRGYDFETLKKYGLTSVRSVRHIPASLSKFLNDV